MNKKRLAVIIAIFIAMLIIGWIVTAFTDDHEPGCGAIELVKPGSPCK